jgi:hypothetical protein
MRDDNKKFTPADEAQKLASPLIEKHHSHLVNAKILFVFKEGTWNKGGKPCSGEVKCLSPLMATIAELDFCIILNHKYWAVLDEHFRTILVDHLLSCCNFKEGKDGELTWCKVAPPTLEFPQVVERYGSYNEDLKEMERSMREFADKKGNV